MAINFKKLKSQIHPFKPECKQGYIFIATNEQNNNFICSIALVGSKRRLLTILKNIIHDEDYPEWKDEFSI